MYIKDGVRWSISKTNFLQHWWSWKCNICVYVCDGPFAYSNLTKYNLFRLLVHSSPKTIYIYMYKWKKINMLFKNCCHFNSTTKCVFNGVVSLVQKEFSSNLLFHLCIFEYLVNYVALLEEHNVRDDWIWIWLWSWISSWTKKWLHMTNKCYYHQMKSSF